MRLVGIILIIAGLIWGGVAFNMATTVKTGEQSFRAGEASFTIPSQEVHNLDLAENRQAHLMISGLLIVVGVALFGFGSVRPSSAVSAAGFRRVGIVLLCVGGLSFGAAFTYYLKQREFEGYVTVAKSRDAIDRLNSSPSVDRAGQIGAVIEDAIRSRRDFLWGGTVAFVAGLGLLVWSGSKQGRESSRKCPFCAESIKPDAIVCRFCNRDLVGSS